MSKKQKENQSENSIEAIICYNNAYTIVFNEFLTQFICYNCLHFLFRN